MPVSFETQNVVKEILNVMMPMLNERQQRFLMGSCAKAMGHGGIATVNEITGAARTTIKAGIDEIEVGQIAGSESSERVRRPGAGRKTAQEKNPGLYEKIEEIYILIYLII